MPPHRIKVTGANDEGRPTRSRAFRDIVARLQEATPPAETEEESQQFVDDLIAAVRRERSER